MKIEDLRDLYEKDNVFLTQHVIERCQQRNIRPKHIKAAVMTGEIIEDYPDDFQTPSCLIQRDFNYQQNLMEGCF